jgi:hypothetical protein
LESALLNWRCWRILVKPRGAVGGSEVPRTPFDERELTVLLSALLLLAASVYFRHELRRVAHWKLLAAAISCLVLGGIATLAEHAVAFDFFNTLEHASYLLQSVFLGLWALQTRKARSRSTVT